MTPEEANTKSIDELRNLGYSVIVFNPEELEKTDPDFVMERLVEFGWDVIQQETARHNRDK
jgi:hypothetical protein